MALLRLGPLRHARGGDVHGDRHRQAQRCGPAGLARRCPRPHRGYAADPARRTPPLELCRRAEARFAPHRACPAKAGAGSRPELHRQHHRAANLSPAYPAVLGGCLLTWRPPGPRVLYADIRIMHAALA